MNRKYPAYRREKYKGKKKAPGASSRRRGFSKIKDEELYTLVKESILAILASEWTDLPVYAEGYANEHNVPVHRITQIFMRLNHEGLLSRKKNIEKGEMVRSNPVWNASQYYVRTRHAPNDRNGQYPLRFYTNW